MTTSSPLILVERSWQGVQRSPKTYVTAWEVLFSCSTKNIHTPCIIEPCSAFTRVLHSFDDPSLSSIFFDCSRHLLISVYHHGRRDRRTQATRGHDSFIPINDNFLMLFQNTSWQHAATRLDSLWTLCGHQTSQRRLILRKLVEGVTSERILRHIDVQLIKHLLSLQ